MPAPRPIGGGCRALDGRRFATSHRKFTSSARARVTAGRGRRAGRGHGSAPARPWPRPRPRALRARHRGPPPPYKRLRQALKADIDHDAWQSLYRTRSRPFPVPDSGTIAVKVINHHGDEVLKTYAIE